MTRFRFFKYSECFVLSDFVVNLEFQFLVPSRCESDEDVFWFGDPGENPESLELVDPRSVIGLQGTLEDLLMVTGC